MFVIKWMGSSDNVVKYVDFDSGYRQINFKSTQQFYKASAVENAESLKLKKKASLEPSFKLSTLCLLL